MNRQEPTQPQNSNRERTPERQRFSERKPVRQGDAKTVPTSHSNFSKPQGAPLGKPVQRQNPSTQTARPDGKERAPINNSRFGRQETAKPDPRNTRFAGNRPMTSDTMRKPFVKREESLEDIRADVERVEKDIEFEIKQIQSVKMGL